MSNEKKQTGFQRGVMSLLILALLNKEDMYGYQIVQTIAELSSGKIVTQEGSLYPALYKLQEQGLISDQKVLSGKRMVRVYYHLEESGKLRLQELIQEYQNLTEGVFRIIENGQPAKHSKKPLKVVG